MNKNRTIKIPVWIFGESSKIKTFVTLNKLHLCIQVLFWNNKIEGFYYEENKVYAILNNGNRIIV